MNNTPFNSHLFLGFDELEDMLCKVARTGDSFPPYNIELVDDNTLEISLAVAGYTEQDLEVSLEDTELVIRGRQEPSWLSCRVLPVLPLPSSAAWASTTSPMLP